MINESATLSAQYFDKPDWPAPTVCVRFVDSRVNLQAYLDNADLAWLIAQLQIVKARSDAALALV